MPASARCRRRSAWPWRSPSPPARGARATERAERARPSPACRSVCALVAASARRCAISPSWPEGDGCLPLLDRLDEGGELQPIGAGVALEEEVLHRIGGEAALGRRSRRWSRGCCRRAACRSSRAPRCAGRSHRRRGASWRSGRACPTRSASSPSRCRRRRPCRSPDRPATEPTAWTSTGSSPRRKRAMSKSWIIMSR